MSVSLVSLAIAVVACSSDDQALSRIALTPTPAVSGRPRKASIISTQVALAVGQLDQLHALNQNEAMPKGSLNLYEAKTRLSELVDRASKGETTIIAKDGRPLARLMPLSRRKPQRKPGAGKGKVWIADDFDAPLAEDVLAAFEGLEE